MSDVQFGSCKICGCTTYSMGGPYICKNFNCPAWYLSQDCFVYVRLEDGREGYCKVNQVPDSAQIIEEPSY